MNDRNEFFSVTRASTGRSSAGRITSFAQPGGNVTGLAQPLVDWGKWLELAREAVRGATDIAVIANSTNMVYADHVAQNDEAARRLGLQLQMLPVTSSEDFTDAFAANGP